MSAAAGRAAPPDLADRLAALTRELCAIPSETGSERDIAEWVEVRCREAAPAGTVRRLGNQVVCDPAGPARGPTTGLVGHLDTVRCAQDQPLEVRGGRVYGCGASDMKGGLAVMLELLSRWRELDGRPVFVFYDREEGPYEENGLGPILEAGVLPPLDLTFVLEPTDVALHLGCMGLLHAEVTVAGRRAHSARPWQGENALYRAIPLLERLRDAQVREVERGGLVFREVVTATQAGTDNSKNVVPDAVRLNVNVRFAPGRSPEEAEAELRALVGDLGEVRVDDRAPAGEVVPDHPLLRPWRERHDLPMEPKQAYTDVARFTARGMAAVNFGPGTPAQAHQAGEWCSVDGLGRCCRLLLDYFGVPD